MLSPKCPGQDTRYWKPDDIYELKCAQCGAAVEFFKTDGSRHCPDCGSRITNPRVTFGCAQWCEHAVSCLGYDPKTVHVKSSTESSSLADRIIETLKTRLGSDSERLARALSTLENAREILRRNDGNPRVVIAAALLYEIGVGPDERKRDPAAPTARQILHDLNVDQPTIEHVCQIVAPPHAAPETDTLEAGIVRDARRMKFA